MRKLLLALAAVLLAFPAHATSTLYSNSTSVGVNTTAPTTGVALDLGSNTNSMLVPIGTTGQRPTGVAGMLRYNSTNSIPEFYVSSWLPVPLTASSPISINSTTGNITCSTCNTSAANVNSVSGDGTFYTNSASTGAVTLTLGNATAYSVWGNNTSSGATPAYTTSPELSGTITDIQSIGATSTDGLVLTDTTAATSGNQKWSPRVRWTGQGWKTNATAGSQEVDAIAEIQPVQGTANPTFNWVLSGQVNGGGYGALLTVPSGGGLNLNSGVYEINGTQLAASNLLNGVNGSGSIVLTISPSLTTPNIGAATGTSLAVTGNITTSSGEVGIGNTSPGALLDIGNAGATLGTMRLEGNTSGYVQIQPVAAAGSWTLTLPSSGGTNGYVLSTDGSGVTSWVSAGAGTSALSALTSATTTNAFDNVGYGQTWTWNSLAGSSALTLSTSSTSAASNAQTMLNISLTGTNGTSGQTTYGEQISNTHGGSGTNVGLSATASGGTNNYAAVFPSGNVGVGTASPAGTLDVEGGTAAASTNGTSINIVAQSGGTGNQDGGNIILIPGMPTGTGGLGGVGIGTTSPAGMLDVVGSDFTIRRATSTDGGTINIGSGSYQWQLIGNEINAGDLLFYNPAGDPVIYMSYTGGYVGIDNSSPSYLLHVGSSSASGIVMELQNSSGACTYNPGASSVTVSCSSDMRLKSDIQDSKDALAWVDDMRIRDFTVKATGERKTGVVAQEIMLKYPEMVHKDAKGIYLVDEPNPWKLVKTIQELHSLLEKQQVEIDELNRRIGRSQQNQPKPLATGG